MVRRMASLFLLSSALIVGGLAVADDKPALSGKLGEVPKINPMLRPSLTDAEKKHIKDLIASLSGIDTPDYGLSAMLSGSNFSPIAGQEQIQSMLITNYYEVAPSKSVKELATIGPEALPFLLDALADKTPTKLVVKQQVSIGGGMFFGKELELNPLIPADRKSVV